MFYNEHTNKKVNNEKGMVAVETILSFTVFIVVIAALVYFINIFTVHNRIQFAINSAAHELASYSYFYEALGIRRADAKFHKDWASDVDRMDETTVAVAKSLNEMSKTYDSAVSTYESGVNTINGAKGVLDEAGEFEISLDSFSELQNIYSDAQGVVDQGKETKEQLDKTIEQAEVAIDATKDASSKVVGLMKNPQSMISGMVGLALYEANDQVKTMVGTACAEALTEKYLVNNGLTADQYLRSYGVVDGYAGLDFSSSSVFRDTKAGADGSQGKGQMIDIVVKYKINIGFLGLLMKDPTVDVVQRVTVPGWLGGDDNHASEKLGLE